MMRRVEEPCPTPSPRARGFRLPPHVYFVVSAVFHYLGPAFAVLLFRGVPPLGVAWLRVASAAVSFGIWRRPWRSVLQEEEGWRVTVVALGLVLGVMNSCFYLALARLPLATVGAIEFLSPLALALYGTRTRRNLAALILAVGGVALLTEVKLVGDPLGFVFAFANCLLFGGYVWLAHRLAQTGRGLDGLAAAMPIGLLTVTPLGLLPALPAFRSPPLLLAGIGVGISSSVIPYVTDQLAMARLPRATYAMFLALLPACAAIIGAGVLRQIPTPAEIAGVLLVVAGVGLRRD